MSLLRSLLRLTRSPVRVLRDRRGTGAVEFAIVFPFLLLLYAGASELTLGITVDRKVNNAASTIADLVTQNGSITREQLQVLMQLAGALVEPFDPRRMSITVTSVRIDADRRAFTDWSSDPARYPKGTPFVGLPAGIANQTSRHLIVTETLYRYRPVVMASVLGDFEMSRKAYNLPRTGDLVNCTNCR